MNKPTGKLAFAYATISRHEQTIATLRQQLEEAQARAFLAEENVKKFSALCDAHELLAVTRDSRFAREQRLANAEAQEVAAWEIQKEGSCWHTKNKKHAEEYAALGAHVVALSYLHPAPPAADERVKELEGWTPAKYIPADGLYVAIYQEGPYFVVGLASYDKYEFMSEDEEIITGHGWHCEEDEDFYLRDVICYQPINYDMASLAKVRAALAASKGEK